MANQPLIYIEALEESIFRGFFIINLTVHSSFIMTLYKKIANFPDFKTILREICDLKDPFLTFVLS